MTWQYIPYSLYDTKGCNGGHYNRKKAMSFNCDIIIILGARGVGKTFSIKEYLLNEFLYKNYKFVWVRDTVDAKKELCENDGSRFFADFPLMKNKDFKSGCIKKSEFYINDKHAGTCLPASVFQRYKGNSFQDAKIVVYDEFIKEKGRMINKNNLWATINTLMTICRERDNLKIIMMANALDRGDEFLQFLGVNIKDFGFYINRKKSVCIHYADNSAEFNRKNSAGVIGKLLIDTTLSNNLMQSEFLNITDLFFDKLPPKAKLLLIIETPLQNVRIYQGEGKLFVTEDVNKETYKNKRYVAEIEYASKIKPVIPLKIKNTIKEALSKNIIMFKNDYVRKFILLYFK